MTADSDDRPANTLLRALLGRGQVLSAWRLFLGALVATGFGAVLVVVAGLPTASTLTIFLAAVALQAPTRELIDDNAAAIWQREESPWVANRRTAFGVAALFLGMFVGFVGLSVWSHHSGAVISSTGLQSQQFDRGFAVIFEQNLFTLALFLVLGFVYRTYGALLAMGWNAARWAGVLIALVYAGLPEVSASPLSFIAHCALAVLPHLLIDASAYVLATLGAIFASRAITRYGLRDPRLRRVGRAVVVLIVVAVALLAAGAATEQTVPRLVLGWVE